MSDQHKNHESEYYPWFPKEMLQDGVHFALENQLFEELNHLYQAIPEGECGGCADCCMESVETHWVEFLQVYHYLHQRPELLEQVLPKLIRFYLLEGVEKRHCPFQLENRRCAVYPVRPTPCRLFGQWGQADYEENYRLTQGGNREAAEYYAAEYGIKLPKEVVEHKVPYCETFKKPADYSQEDFHDHLAGIMALHSKLLAEDLMDEDLMSLGLVCWWMGSWFDLDELHEQKVELMRRYLAEGESGVAEKLAQVVEQVLQLRNSSRE